MNRQMDRLDKDKLVNVTRMVNHLDTPAAYKLTEVKLSSRKIVKSTI